MKSIGTDLEIYGTLLNILKMFKVSSRFEKYFATRKIIVHSVSDPDPDPGRSNCTPKKGKVKKISCFTSGLPL